MSRIDEALKALERGTGGERSATRTEAPPRTAAATLDIYAGEDGQGATRHAPRSRAAQAFDPEPTARPEITRPADAAASDGRLIGRHASPVIVEQYRRLAAALHDEQMQRNLNTVMVTSAVPREGKTLTTLNLALTLGESYNRRVLVVDADLRRPSIHEVLGIANTRGLSDALRDHALDAPFVALSRNVSVLTSGQSGSAPLAELTSERMGILLDEFEGRFDWVLIDTPPVGFLPDAQLLARLIQAVVFVVGARSTPAPVVKRAIAALGTECILGVVLNRVEERRIQDAGYYYGDGADASSARVR